MIQKLKSSFLMTALATTSIMLSSCEGLLDDSESIPNTAGLLGNVGGNSGYEIEDTDSVYPYRESSPYADVLKKCVLVDDREDSCSVAKLPFIGDGDKQPSIEDIMNRVLVTHDWMGLRFEDMLLTAPPEVITMFSSATAVLIGSNVRPSYYTTVSGAIQIDPVYLWSTVEEKQSISKQEDFRSSFGNDLQFFFISRTANKFGEPLTPYYSLDDDSERPIEHIKLPLMRLLIHELTHATDYMPRSEIQSLNTSLSVYDAISSVRDKWLSPLLYTTDPLTSNELRELASVRFLGLEASNSQAAMTAGDVGGLMGTDGAAQFYSYTTIREDIAQLVETVIMSVRYDAKFNIGYVQKPADLDNYDCTDLLVSWGQRNRLADPLVGARARKAVELVLGTTPDVLNYMNNSLGYSEAMQNNLHWCANQAATLADMPSELARSGSKPTFAEQGDLFREMIRQSTYVHPDNIHHQ